MSQRDAFRKEGSSVLVKDEAGGLSFGTIRVAGFQIEEVKEFIGAAMEAVSNNQEPDLPCFVL